MLIMIVKIGILAAFFGDFLFFIYSATAGVNRVIRKYPGRVYRLECLTCGRIEERNDEEEFIRLKRKPRNLSPSGRVSYRLPCAKCGQKTMQTLLDLPWRKETVVWICKSWGIVALIGLCCAVSLAAITEP